MIKGNFLYKNPKCNKSLFFDREFEQCFVWKTNNFPIYIMDNHRAALWCWMQEIQQSDKKISLLHIDAHADLSRKGLCDKDCFKKLKVNKVKIDEYLTLKHFGCKNSSFIKKEIYSYENFLTFFIKMYESKLDINKTKLTKEISDTDDLSENLFNESGVDFIEDLHLNKITKIQLLDFLNEDLNKLIIDLDMDYFFNRISNKIDYTFANEVFLLLKKLFDERKILVLTIAWSPEYLIDSDKPKKQTTKNGWVSAQKLNDKFCKIFGIDPTDFKNI